MPPPTRKLTFPAKSYKPLFARGLELVAILNKLALLNVGYEPTRVSAFQKQASPKDNGQSQHKEDIYM